MTRISYKSEFSLSNKNRLPYIITSSLPEIYSDRTNEIFVPVDDNSALYIKASDLVNKGLEMHGFFPLLPVPIVFFPWYSPGKCVEANKSVFLISLINKKKEDQVHSQLNLDSVVLSKASDAKKIKPSSLKKYGMGQVLHREYRNRRSIVDAKTKKIIFNSGQLFNGEAGIFVFDIGCRDLDDYELILRIADQEIRIGLSYQKRFGYYFVYD